MGAFYRSKHELIFVFKYGDAPHTNSFGLGDTGRYRTNVWDYAGISSPTASRDEELAMHPTVKPVPYTGVQFVAIPEFQGMATTIGQQFSAALAGTVTIDAALASAQATAEAEMKKAGYVK